MWHNISLRNIFDESDYLQTILSANTAVINNSVQFINRTFGANNAHIDKISSERNFQKYAQSVKKMNINLLGLNNNGCNAELSTTLLHPIRSIMNDNAHANRRAAQGRDPCRSRIRE